MPVLELKDKKYVVQLLSVLDRKGQVTFDITDRMMRVSTLRPPFFYLCIPGSLYSIDGPASFTIAIEHVLENINRLASSTIELEQSFRIVERDPSAPGGSGVLSYIDIPFTLPIEAFYQHTENFSTRLFIRKGILKHLIRGSVTYMCEDRLVLKRYGDGCHEVMRIDAEFLEEGELHFSCSNDWVDGLLGAAELLSTVQLCFAEGRMHVKALFTKHDKAYLEIVVLEKLQ
ncbi:hypothetical protein PAPHI01_0935 [Pancytospora philotis]|nr:hypothetical protein PAPHI01_0935 [Pancytospora philotis]